MSGPSQAHPRRHAVIVDTTAPIPFFTTTGVLNERFVAGMAWDQVVYARLPGAVLMIPAGRHNGVWRAWMMRYAGPSRLSRLLRDTGALVRFQVPICAAIIAVSGASGRGLL